MPTRPATWLMISGLMLTQAASAAERNYIKKNERFCDSDKVLCIDGTISYEPNTRILSLRARVQKQTGPGEIRLNFSGTNRQGSIKRTEIVMKIRGRHSEILDRRIRPDAPDVSNWKLDRFVFKKE